MNNLVRFSRLALLTLCVSVFAAEARADVKIKSRQTVQGHSFENAVYIKGKRQRTEQAGGQSVTIQQCDLRRDIQIMPAMKAYTVNPYDDNNAEPVNTPAAGPRPRATPTTQGGLVTSTITTRDTGERKQMFGYTARHIITTIETKSSPEACNPTDSKMETDGWYIDAAFQLDCDMERFARYSNPQPHSGGCRDRHESKVIGAARRGYPVSEKTTMFDREGRVTMSILNEVVELSQATLEASLFEPPADFKEVKDFSAASMMASMGGMRPRGDDEENPAQPSSAGRPQMSAPEVGAKRPGVTRIGLASVQTGAVGDNLNAAQLAAAVRAALSSRLTSATVEVVPIDSYAEAEAEAKRKGCDFIVYANVSHKKGGGGGFGGMLGRVGSAAAGIGGMGDGSGGGTATSNVKAKDELTLDVRLQAPGAAAPAASSQFKAKAKSAGEDIITPAVEQAAQLLLGSMKQ